MATQVDARKTKLKRTDALKLTKDVTQIFVAKGKKVTLVKMKDNPDNATLAGLLLGPTGNLRAPTIRKGKTLVVGFSEDLYRDLFAKK